MDNYNDSDTLNYLNTEKITKIIKCFEKSNQASSKPVIYNLKKYFDFLNLLNEIIYGNYNFTHSSSNNDFNSIKKLQDFIDKLGKWRDKIPNRSKQIPSLLILIKDVYNELQIFHKLFKENDFDFNKFQKSESNRINRLRIPLILQQLLSKTDKGGRYPENKKYLYDKLQAASYDVTNKAFNKAFVYNAIHCSIYFNLKNDSDDHDIDDKLKNVLKFLLSHQSISKLNETTYKIKEKPYYDVKAKTDELNQSIKTILNLSISNKKNSKPYPIYYAVENNFKKIMPCINVQSTSNERKSSVASVIFFFIFIQYQTCIETNESNIYFFIKF